MSNQNTIADSEIPDTVRDALLWFDQGKQVWAIRLKKAWAPSIEEMGQWMIFDLLKHYNEHGGHTSMIDDTGLRYKQEVYDRFGDLEKKYHSGFTHSQIEEILARVFHYMMYGYRQALNVYPNEDIVMVKRRMIQ